MVPIIRMGFTSFAGRQFERPASGSTQPKGSAFNRKTMEDITPLRGRQETTCEGDVLDFVSGRKKNGVPTN
ncbi:hypothetical protein ACFL4G_11510, partial [Thermodesulfobacteriota bacterium]